MSSSATAMDAEGFIKPNNSEMEVICAVLKHMKSEPEVDWEEVSKTAGLKDGTVAQTRFRQVCLELNLLGAITAPKKAKKSSAGKSEATRKVSRTVAEVVYDDPPTPTRPSKRARPAPGAYHQSPAQELISPVLQSIEYDGSDEADEAGEAGEADEAGEAREAREPVVPPAVDDALPPHLTASRPDPARNHDPSIETSSPPSTSQILMDTCEALMIAVDRGVWRSMESVSDEYSLLAYDFANVHTRRSVEEISIYIQSVVESDRRYSGYVVPRNTDPGTATTDNDPLHVRTPATPAARPGPTRAGGGIATHSVRTAPAGHTPMVLPPLERAALAPRTGLQNQLPPRSPLREFPGHNQQENAIPPRPARWWNDPVAYSSENADPYEI